MAKKRKPRGSSKAGRPKKTGDRYACGKLKPAGPNVVTLERRKAGDASAGEHPLDFALSQQWITEQMHRDAMSYRASFNAAHIGAYGPRLALGSLVEVEPAETLRMSWSTLSDEEITGIFDKVFNRTEMEDPEKAQIAALARWKLLNAALTPNEREELFRVCVLGSWPFWMPKKAAEQAMGWKDLLKEQQLIDALGAVGRASRPAKAKGDAITPVPFKPTRSGRSELPIRYETETGIEVEPESERGRPFEAVILRKRA